MLRIADSFELQPDGGMLFIGNPPDLRAGDEVLDRTQVVIGVKKGEHEHQPATIITLVEAKDWLRWQTRNASVANVIQSGRVALVDNTQVKFYRYVETENSVEYEPEVNQEFYTADDRFDAWSQKWEGRCRDIPQGLLVVLGKDMEAKIVDSAYSNGAVLFSDGSAFQSHPDRTWIGWQKPTEEALPPPW